MSQSASGISLIQSQMNELFRQTNKLNYEVEGQINEIYCGKESTVDIKQLSQRIKEKISTLNKQMEELEQLYAEYVNTTKQCGKFDQDNSVYWQKQDNSYILIHFFDSKIERLRQSLGQQPTNLDKAVRNYNRVFNEDKRSTSTVERRKFKDLQKEQDSLDRSQQYAHEIEKHGESIINSLYSQNQTLKKVKQRAFQMLNTIGMSESIMKLIEKRNKMDLIIFIGLTIFTIVFIYACMYYIRPMLWGSSTN